MLEIVEIIRPADQGRTTPFLCTACDGNSYFVKGYAASSIGLVKEWMGANLAQAFGLPVPEFQLAYLADALANAYEGPAASELKGGYVFASKQIPSVTELKFETIPHLDKTTRLAVLLFDLWVEHEDRTLTELGGNPNLLWKPDESKLYVIDHNLIFDPAFSHESFWTTHVFKSEFRNKQDDFIEKQTFEARMQKALDSWQSAWDKVPPEWLEYNADYSIFNPNQHIQRLTDDANGNLWLKLP
ncbi:hypothetical protein IVG45_18940 [Methylomonas sp. LL1]|uniref:HipA family kinase n=1 Tax=Methylomonas sp. LL1 TaxID=2785785 RepID=UPI0018C3EF91|nr:HipA family kinase [Methylomonas sp. LL1]QPK62878.1 hypothetical protein IVG45_18940 [Methylomonas sp. LL1]